MRIDLTVFRQNHFAKCQDACKIFGFVLQERYKRQFGQHKGEWGLSIFDLDKTLRLADKIWEKRAAELLYASRENEQSRIVRGRFSSFPVERNYNDKHGHRLAFPPPEESPNGITRECKPVLDTMRCFDKYAAPPNKFLIALEEETDWGRIKRFRPQVSAAALTPLVGSGRIDDDDIVFLTRIGGCCGILEENEIVALGRHESPEATVESILVEFQNWFEVTAPLFQEGAIIDDKTLKFLEDQLWECWSWALECRRKTGLSLSDIYTADRELYDVALEKLTEEIQQFQGHSNDREKRANEQLLRALALAQPPAKSIWRDPRVSRLEVPAFFCWAFANYFSGTLKELPIFEGSSLSGKLSRISRQDVLLAYESVARFVNVTKDLRPVEFTSSWWNSIHPMESDLFGRLISPNEVWTQAKTPIEFIQDTSRIFFWIWHEHIDPLLESRREQDI